MIKLLSSPMMGQILRFGVVGTIGFVVDGRLLTLVFNGVRPGLLFGPGDIVPGGGDRDLCLEPDLDFWRAGAWPRPSSIGALAGSDVRVGTD